MVFELVYERWMVLGGYWGRGGDIEGGSEEWGGVMWGLFKNYLEKKKWILSCGEGIIEEFLFRLKYDLSCYLFYI